MSTGALIDTLVTLAVPAAFVAAAWALAVCALNRSDEPTQWFHRLFSHNRRGAASLGDRSSASKSKNSFANPKDL
ncbi:MAG TPA: hypothetical protein PKE16_15350 [Hyphomicrobium sp.]|nr:hypothetical protein [Hyphomicrobium sp.]